MLKYYVYAYIRGDGTPYYIGKGCGNRAFEKGKGEIGVPKELSRIILVEQNLTNTGALAIERRLIRWYGRIDNGTGILRNKTDGGDGVVNSNHVRMPHSEETKKKLSVSRTGKKRGAMREESKQKLSKSMYGKNKGKTRTEEQKKAQSIIQSGIKRKPPTQETKDKIRKSLEGVPRGPQKPEHSKKISDALTGVPKKRESVEKQRQKVLGRKPSDEERKNYLLSMEKGKTMCEHCDKTFTLGNYRRWHGDRCKNKSK